MTLPQALARIKAAKERIGDLKGVHTRWYEGRSEFADEARVISEMESIAYSAWLYLDGVPGRYLSKEDAGERS